MARKQDILSILGWGMEDYYRYWYDMYHNSIGGIIPAAPNVIKHYTQIPTRYIIKFSRKRK